jgi:hypothetical protein
MSTNTIPPDLADNRPVRENVSSIILPGEGEHPNATFVITSAPHQRTAGKQFYEAWVYAVGTTLRSSVAFYDEWARGILINFVNDTTGADYTKTLTEALTQFNNQ